MIVGLILLQEDGTCRCTSLDERTEDRLLGLRGDFGEPGCGHKSFGRFVIDHSANLAIRRKPRRPTRRRDGRRHRVPRSKGLNGGRGGCPIVLVLIVHIVSGAAIRKFFLNRAVLSGPVGAAESVGCGGPACRCNADVEGPRGDVTAPDPRLTRIWWEETP